MKSFIIVDNQSTKGRTGIQSVIYAYDGIVRITCTYDFMDCRATIKVESISTNPSTGERETIIILHQRFLYRGYLQIAACDLTSEGSPKLWHILWDPTQPVATRPLAIQQDDTWYCYGWDLTKNICELFQSDGSIGAAYAYAPFGEVTATGAVAQPFQWSSEYHDTELGMVYYNYRHYIPCDVRWISRDPFPTHTNSYLFVKNNPLYFTDLLGLKLTWSKVVNAYDEDVLFDDLVGSISLKLKIDNEDPVNSSDIVFYREKGSINYQKHDTTLEEIDDVTKVITFSATVSASLIDYGDVCMIGTGIAAGTTTGAALGGSVGTLGAGIGVGLGAAVGAIAGSAIGGIGGACYGKGVNVSLLLKAKLTCKCINSNWQPSKIEDYSENARGKSKRNGDLYINVK